MWIILFLVNLFLHIQISQEGKKAVLHHLRYFLQEKKSLKEVVAVSI